MIAALALALALGTAADVDRILVLDLEAVGVDKNVARAVDPLVLNAAAVEGVEVVAQSELKKLAEMEASRAELGCDTSSCLAEMAGAMGARLVLFGSVSQLGRHTTVALSLYDNNSGVITRDNVVVADIGALNDDAPPRVKALVEKALGRQQTPPPPPHREAPPPEPPSSMFLAGMVCAIAGGAALVGGGAFAIINEVTVQDPTALSGTKQAAQENGAVGLAVAGIGVVVAGAGAALMVLGGGED